MITGMGTSWCQVRDMQKSIAFYRDVLGLKPIMESPFWSEFELPPFKFALHSMLGGTEGPLGENGRGWNLGMASDDLADLRQRVREAGAAEFGYHEVPGGVVLALCDLDGNPIQVMQRGVTLAELS